MLASAIPRSRTFPPTLATLPAYQTKGEFVSARRQNQHARRMRYPKTEPVLASFWQSHHQADILISFAACIQFSADGAGISFVQKSRKPSFSLGLQSFLELLLHKIGVPRVSHSVHETDALIQKQLDKTNVHGMHAVRSSDLN